MPTPYAEHLDGRDPVDVLRSSLADYENLMPSFNTPRWRSSYAPGKWSAQQVMLHVTQWEMIFSVRVRCGVSFPGYVVQPMSQDPFMQVEAPAVDGPVAWDAFRSMRVMNLALASS